MSAIANDSKKGVTSRFRSLPISSVAVPLGRAGADLVNSTVELGVLMVGGLLIAVGGPELGWRLVFFVNVPIAVVVLVLARRLLPETPSTGRHRLDVGGSLLLGAATFCVLFTAVGYLLGPAFEAAEARWGGVIAIGAIVLSAAALAWALRRGDR